MATVGGSSTSTPRPFQKVANSREECIYKRDIVLVLYDKIEGKGEYRLGRIVEVYPDVNSNVRTVKVGMRKRDQCEKLMPYLPKLLQEIEVGVQRIAVICPVEEQMELGDGIRCGKENVENEVSCEDKIMEYGENMQLTEIK